MPREYCPTCGEDVQVDDGRCPMGHVVTSDVAADDAPDHSHEDPDDSAHQEMAGDAPEAEPDTEEVDVSALEAAIAELEDRDDAPDDDPSEASDDDPGFVVVDPYDEASADEDEAASVYSDDAAADLESALEAWDEDVDDTPDAEPDTTGIEKASEPADAPHAEAALTEGGLDAQRERAESDINDLLDEGAFGDELTWEIDVSGDSGAEPDTEDVDEPEPTTQEEPEAGLPAAPQAPEEPEAELPSAPQAPEEPEAELPAAPQAPEEPATAPASADASADPEPTIDAPSVEEDEPFTIDLEEPAPSGPADASPATSESAEPEAPEAGDVAADEEPSDEQEPGLWEELFGEIDRFEDDDDPEVEESFDDHPPAEAPPAAPAHPEPEADDVEHDREDDDSEVADDRSATIDTSRFTARGKPGGKRGIFRRR